MNIKTAILILGIKWKHLHFLTQYFNKNICSLKQHAMIYKWNEGQGRILHRHCNLNVSSTICWLKGSPPSPSFS